MTSEHEPFPRPFRYEIVNEDDPPTCPGIVVRMSTEMCGACCQYFDAKDTRLRRRMSVDGQELTACPHCGGWNR